MLQNPFQKRISQRALSLLTGAAVTASCIHGAVAQTAQPREIPVVEATVLKAGLDSRSAGAAFAAKGDGKGFFAITGFGNSVLSLSPWGAVQARLSLSMPAGAYVSRIFTLTPGRALVYAENPGALGVVSTVTNGPTEVLYPDTFIDVNTPLKGVAPTSVVQVNGSWFLISSSNSTNAILFDLQSQKVLATADLQIKYARMAKDPISGKIYAFGQDTVSHGSMPYAASAVIDVTNDGRISVNKKGLSNSSMGTSNLIRKVVASEKAARVVAVGVNGSIGYHTSPNVPDLHRGIDYGRTFGESGTISSDGRYLFVASSGMSSPCNGTGGTGITEIDLVNPASPRRCLAGLQAKVPDAYAFDLYTDVTSGLTFGYFNDVVKSQQPTNFRISVFKNGREPDLAGRANGLVGQAKAACAAVPLIGARSAQGCSVFSGPSGTPIPK